MNIFKQWAFTLLAALIAAIILMIKKVGPIYLLVPEDLFIVDIVVSVLVVAAGFLIDSSLSQIARLKTLDMELRRSNEELAAANKSLVDSLAQIKVLRGLLPMCARCGRMRDDQGEWQDVDAYLRSHSEAKIMNTLCPQCRDRF